MKRPKNLNERKRKELGIINKHPPNYLDPFLLLFLSLLLLQVPRLQETSKLSHEPHKTTLPRCGFPWGNKIVKGWAWKKEGLSCARVVKFIIWMTAPTARTPGRLKMCEDEERAADGAMTKRSESSKTQVSSRWGWQKGEKSLRYLDAWLDGWRMKNDADYGWFLTS